MSETSSPATRSRRQSDWLKTIIVTFLAPMFLWACEGDVDLARIAAAETLDEFGILDHRGMITAARIIAYELAALSSLSQSMEDDIPPALALRLRSNANSLDRAAERNRQALALEQRAARAQPVDVDAVAASVAETQELVRAARARAQAAPVPDTPRPAGAAPQGRPARSPAPMPDAPVRPSPTPQMPPQATPARQGQPKETQALWNTIWAEAMADVAAEFTADLARLPPAERAMEKARIDLLLEASTALASGTAAPYGNPLAPAGRPGTADGNAAADLSPSRPGVSE
jgi:hypothetical protein